LASNPSSPSPPGLVGRPARRAAWPLHRPYRPVPVRCSAVGSSAKVRVAHQPHGHLRGDARLTVAMGDPGCLSLFGRDDAANKAHRLLADHLDRRVPREDGCPRPHCGRMEAPRHTTAIWARRCRPEKQEDGLRGRAPSASPGYQGLVVEPKLLGPLGKGVTGYYPRDASRCVARVVARPRRWRGRAASAEVSLRLDAAPFSRFCR